MRKEVPLRRARWFAALTVLVSVSVLVLPVHLAGASGTGDDYPSRNMPCALSPYSVTGYCNTPTGPYDWGPDRNNVATTNSTMGFGYRNCTDFVAWRLNQQLGRTSAPWAFLNKMTGPNGQVVVWGNAATWSTAAQTGHWAMDSNPGVGSVAQWNANEGGHGSFGHVAIVMAINPDKSVVTEDYNFASTGIYAPHNPVSAPRYIHIADAPRPTPANGDINGDGMVNILDLSIMATNWAKTVTRGTKGDLNGDSVVNILDLSMMATNWQKGATW